ncbi:uncharacterized protein EV154DRAFT_572418 [Mucor mucedo]|uniref:uncharacterized protein n=1 Tax=Mucor mucedo TaxID=29922 RepID=UPI00222105FC|nr:uncharacterized protein EV154DRAFT_572418 [Mucor mucedo]KAI7864550.1 hypothetical protein EV154DRAFT_572418 [Mucor mucedo]
MLTIYFHHVNYRSLDESSKLLFGIEHMIPDVKQTYSALKEPATSIANMLITEGLNQKTALSLINFFAQDVWSLIGNTNAFRESFEYRTQMSRVYLNSVNAMNKVFVTKDQAILDRTFGIFFPDTSETNLLDQITDIEKGTKVYVGIYSRTGYVFVMNALSRLNRQEEAHQFHIMLKEIAYKFLIYLPDINAVFKWTRYKRSFSLLDERVHGHRDVAIELEVGHPIHFRVIKSVPSFCLMVSDLSNVMSNAS